MESLYSLACLMSGLLAVASKDHHRFHYIIRLSKPNTSLGCTSAAADSAANFNDELNGQGDRKTGSEWALERGCQRGPIIQQNQRSIIQGGTCLRTDNELSLSLVVMWWRRYFWCRVKCSSSTEDVSTLWYQIHPRQHHLLLSCCRSPSPVGSCDTMGDLI